MANKALEKLKQDGEIQTLLPDNDRYTNRFEIKSESSNRLYIVAQTKKSGEWQCSCPGWITRRKCKHLTTLTPLLSEVGKNKKPDTKKISAPVDVEIDVHDPFFTDKKSLWAKKLDGRQYGDEITDDEEKKAKKDGIVIVYGYSDDNVEFRGAIHEEIECYEGEKIFFKKTGNNFTDGDGMAPLTYMKDKSKAEKNMIEAVWCPRKPDCSWMYKTKITHETFKIYEDKELFCIGIVFDINDLK